MATQTVKSATKKTAKAARTPRSRSEDVGAEVCNEHDGGYVEVGEGHGDHGEHAEVDGGVRRFQIYFRKRRKVRLESSQDCERLEVEVKSKLALPIAGETRKNAKLAALRFGVAANSTGTVEIITRKTRM